MVITSIQSIVEEWRKVNIKENEFPVITLSEDSFFLESLQYGGDVKYVTPLLYVCGVFSVKTLFQDPWGRWWAL